MNPAFKIVTPAALAVLTFVTGCAPTTDADEGNEEEAVANLDEASGATGLTPFSSGDVDLTRYSSAGETEWAAFESFFSSSERHGEAGFETIKGRVEELSATLDIPQLNLAALRGYTSANPGASGVQDYKIINTALRTAATNGSDPNLDKVEGYIKSAVSALNALPGFDGTTYRRLALRDCDEACLDKFVAQYEVGATKVEPAFLSTSADDQRTCPFGGHIRYVIEGHERGHDIAKTSDFAFEREVLFAPGTKFVVTKVERDVESTCEGKPNEIVIEMSATP